MMFGVSLPKIFQLEITNVCNYRCPMCPIGQGYRPNPRYLSMKVIENWLRKGYFDNTDRLEGLHVLGEPTLHPDFTSIVELFGEYGVPVCDATNGWAFSRRDMVKRFLKLKNLKVWIIGIDSTTYDEWVRVKGVIFSKRFWEKMMEGLDFYLKNVTNTKAIVRIVESPWSGNIEEFMSFWGKYEELNPMVKVEVKFLDTFAGRYHQKFIRRPTLKESQGICPEPFRNIVVLSNGDIVPCCYIYDNSVTYGNLMSEDLESIWKGKKRYSFIESMVKKNYSKPCSECREWLIPSDVEVLDNAWNRL